MSEFVVIEARILLRQLLLLL